MGFFRRYNLLVGLTFGGAFLLSAWLFAQRVAASVDEALARANGRLREQAQYLDGVLGATTHHVDALELLAQRFLAIGPRVESPEETATLSALQPASGDRFVLAADRVDPALHGQLQVFGAPDEARRRELRMALALNPLFPAVRRNVKDVAWAYYLSASGFMNLYPWTPGQMPDVDRDVYQTEGYRIATPEQNPGRKRRWSSAYLDYGGKGLMVTCARPVYDGDRFLGEVGLDITLGFLNEALRNFDARGADFFLINDHDQLIAHRELVTDRAREVLPATAALPPLAHSRYRALLRVAPGQRIALDDHWGMRAPLSRAPWQLVVLLPRRALWLAPLQGMSGVVLVLIVGVLITIGVSQRTIRRRIVEPAGALVRHIERGGREHPDDKAPLSPEWLPWFSRITRTFEENRAHAHELEQRVAARTSELNERNAELEAAMRQLEDAQQELVLREKLASLGSLAAGVAHEINNPVAAIAAAADNVERCAHKLREVVAADASPQAQRLLSLLDQNARALKEGGARVANTAAALLPFDDLERGEIRELDFNLVVQRAIESFSAELREGVTIETELTPCAQIKGNPNDLGRAFIHVLRNAQAAIDGPGKIEVSTRQRGDSVTVQVRDSGRPLERAEVAKLFDLNFSARHSHVRMGLGLTIAYAVVRKHGGRIEVDSSPAGNTVELTLPAASSSKARTAG